MKLNKLKRMTNLHKGMGNWDSNLGHMIIGYQLGRLCFSPVPSFLKYVTADRRNKHSYSSPSSPKGNTASLGL